MQCEDQGKGLEQQMANGDGLNEMASPLESMSSLDNNGGIDVLQKDDASLVPNGHKGVDENQGISLDQAMTIIGEVKGKNADLAKPDGNSSANSDAVIHQNGHKIEFDESLTNGSQHVQDELTDELKASHAECENVAANGEPPQSVVELHTNNGFDKTNVEANMDNQDINLKEEKSIEEHQISSHSDELSGHLQEVVQEDHPDTQDVSLTQSANNTMDLEEKPFLQEQESVHQIDTELSSQKLKESLLSDLKEIPKDLIEKKMENDTQGGEVSDTTESQIETVAKVMQTEVSSEVTILQQDTISEAPLEEVTITPKENIQEPEEEASRIIFQTEINSEDPTVDSKDEKTSEEPIVEHEAIFTEEAIKSEISQSPITEEKIMAEESPVDHETLPLPISEPPIENNRDAEISQETSIVVPELVPNEAALVLEESCEEKRFTVEIVPTNDTTTTFETEKQNDLVSKSEETNFQEKIETTLSPEEFVREPKLELDAVVTTLAAEGSTSQETLNAAEVVLNDASSELEFCSITMKSEGSSSPGPKVALEEALEELGTHFQECKAETEKVIHHDVSLESSKVSLTTQESEAPSLESKEPVPEAKSESVSGDSLLNQGMTFINDVKSEAQKPSAGLISDATDVIIKKEIVLEQNKVDQEPQVTISKPPGIYQNEPSPDPEAGQEKDSFCPDQAPDEPSKHFHDQKDTVNMPDDHPVSGESQSLICDQADKLICHQDVEVPSKTSLNSQFVQNDHYKLERQQSPDEEPLLKKVVAEVKHVAAEIRQQKDTEPIAEKLKNLTEATGKPDLKSEAGSKLESSTKPVAVRTTVKKTDLDSSKTNRKETDNNHSSVWQYLCGCLYGKSKK